MKPMKDISRKISKSKVFTKTKSRLQDKKVIAGAMMVVLLAGLSLSVSLIGNKKDNPTVNKTSGSSLNGKLKDTSGLNDGTNSVACKMFSSEDITKIFTVSLEKKQGFVDSDTETLKTSSCIFVEKESKNKLVVSILLREYKAENGSEKALQALKQNYSGEKKDLKLNKDGYFFNVQSNQLTVLNGSKLITITINTEDSSFNKEQALTSLSNLDW
jgi:hypothetical protein